MTPLRKTRALLLAVTALTALSSPGLAQTINNGGNQFNIPGVTVPEVGIISRNPTPRAGVTSSVDQTLQDPGVTVASEYSPLGDNLGNHTAVEDLSLNGNDLLMNGGDLVSDGGRVLGIALTPAEEAEAASKYYVDQLGTDLTNAITVIEGDVQTLFERRINTPLNQGLSGGGPLTSDLTLTVDGTVVRTTGTQSIGGEKTFTGAVSLNGGRLFSVAVPEAPTDGVNKAYVDGIGDTLGEEIDALTETFLTRRIDTGTGLLGGGDLSANRTLTFDTTWGDARYALRARVLSAGDGLTGGGDLSANRSFAVDTTVVRTAGNQIIGGNKTFTGLLAFSNGRLTSVGTPTVASDAATKGYVDGVASQIGTDLDTLFARRINTGTGLLGGGDLTADRTLTFDTTWGDARYALAARVLTAGDGLSGGGTLAADRSFAVDGTVVRTSGAQTIAGDKTFRQGTGTRFDRTAGLDGVILRGGAVGTSGFAVTITPDALSANRTLTLADGATTLVPGTMVPTGRSVLSGDGLAGGGDLSATRTLSVDATVLRTAGDQSVAGVKRFTTSPTVPTPVASADAVNKGYVDGVVAGLGDSLSSRRIDTGTGLLGGGDLTANRTLTFDTTWGDARYALAARVLTAGTGLTGGGTLAADRSFGLTGQALALHNLGTNGLFARTGAGTVAARSLAQGAGIAVTNGDGVAGNPTIAVDTTVLRTTGNQSVSGVKGFTTSPTVPTPVADPDAVNKGYVDGVVAGLGDSLSSRRIDTGTGLLGGGDLTANRTLTFDTTWGDARYALAARVLTAGDGLNGGGTLAGDRGFSVDATVLRTTGNQSVAGVKGFTTSPTVPTPVANADAVNKGYVDAAIAGTTYTAGTGLTLNASNQFLITDIAAGSATIGAVRYNGTTASAGRFYGGATAPVNTTRLNYDGALYATRLFDEGVRVVNADLTLTAGTGLTGGGTLAADRSFGLTGQALALHNLGTSGLFARTGVGTVAARSLAQGAGIAVTNGDGVAGNPTIAVDTTVLRTTGNQSVSGVKGFTTSPTVPTPVANADAVNKGYVDAAIAGAAGTSYTAGTGLTLNASDQFLITDIAAGSATVGAVRYNGITSSAGRFYGGTTNPSGTTRLNYGGSLYATNFYATQYFYFSDATLKENVTRLDTSEGMGLIRQIRPVRYDWRDTGREALGVIAQETAAILPNLVDTNEAGLMSVDYIQLIAPLIAAVQDLDARVTQLEEAAADPSAQP